MRYEIFEDKRHGFVKKENQMEDYVKIMTFPDTNLKGETQE